MANNNPFMTPNQRPATTPAAPMPTSSVPSGIDNFEVDLSEVTDGFSIPDGVYRVRCTDVTQDVSKGGNPMFVWQFEVSEGRYAGFQARVFTAITPAAMWKVAETVIALGIGQQGQVVKFKRSDVINRECGALIEKTEYNNQMRSQISRVMSLQEMAQQQA